MAIVTVSFNVDSSLLEEVMERAWLLVDLQAGPGESQSLSKHTAGAVFRDPALTEQRGVETIGTEHH